MQNNKNPERFCPYVSPTLDYTKWLRNFLVSTFFGYDMFMLRKIYKKNGCFFVGASSSHIMRVVKLARKRNYNVDFERFW